MILDYKKLIRLVDSRNQLWYRGYNKEKGEQRDHLLWLTLDIDYAKAYGDTICEYLVDESKCKGCLYDIDDSIDYIDGPTEAECKELLAQGINSYEFEANDDCSTCMCLWSAEPIISRRVLSQEEYDAVEGYED